MKVLIVDDEELTRKSLIKNIDWNSLRINSIFQSDDGIRGLELAKKHQPEIILSDVRMPRMDGIKMVEHLRKILPNSSIIFMSGYSDKEYLKAAINFKAIRYVEKPIILSEIHSALKEAIEYNIKKYNPEDILKEIALKLTYPLKDNDLNSFYIFNILNISSTEKYYCNTIVVNLYDSMPSISSDKLMKINSDFKKFLLQYDFFQINTQKYDQYMVYHIYSKNNRNKELIKNFATYLSKEFNKLCPYFILIGKTICVIINIYDSYASAIALLKSSFFYEKNQILSYYDINNSSKSINFKDPTINFLEVLKSEDSSLIIDTLSLFYESLKNNHMLLPNQIKDIYYKLFLTIKDTYKKIPKSHESILDCMYKSHTLEDLHKLLVNTIEDFFNHLPEYVSKDPIISLIKDFMGNNYNNYSLSVKDISEYVHLSSSYICTYFKNKTGETLNQYLTKYRIEKAKLLLLDPRNTVTEIALRVGYSDSNYFGKSFKKQLGVSPSEYRENILI